MKQLIASGEDLPVDEYWSKGGEGATIFDYVEKVNVEDDEFGGADSQGEDLVDSDFDIPEEATLETEVLGEEPEEKKKKKNVYVDPKRSKKRKAEEDLSESESESEKKRKKSNIYVAPSDRTLRKSTLETSLKQQKEIEAPVSTTKTEKKIVKKFTQEQLLLEAQETEKKNLDSYAQLKKLEDDKKKVVVKKYTIRGPKIIEITNKRGQVLCFEGFPEYPTVIKSKAPPYPTKKVCSVTGLPAPYLDPLTKLPYATLEAFKVIRERHAKVEAEKKKEEVVKNDEEEEDEMEEEEMENKKKEKEKKKKKEKERKLKEKEKDKEKEKNKRKERRLKTKHTERPKHKKHKHDSDSSSSESESENKSKGKAKGKGKSKSKVKSKPKHKSKKKDAYSTSESVTDSEQDSKESAISES
uniref:Vps72/YL1 C-terminal domain-containing protein n=1 Tax=Arcella intermedia TaxID=1963864 RepID=A0A6B2L543_9EUKA